VRVKPRLWSPQREKTIFSTYTEGSVTVNGSSKTEKRCVVFSHKTNGISSHFMKGKLGCWNPADGETKQKQVYIDGR